MAKVYAQVDPWFIQRGYKRTGVRDCRYAIKQNDLLFELHISATPMPDDPDHYSSIVFYSAMIPALGKLHTALLQHSSVSGTPVGNYKGKFATSSGDSPWLNRFLYLEKTTIGDNWQQLLDQFEHDLPIIWSELADAPDLYAAVDVDKHWTWFKNNRGKLLVLLYQQRWDEALAHVRSWTVVDVNPQDLPPEPGKWTAQEELDNAVKVVTEYVDKHR